MGAGLALQYHCLGGNVIDGATYYVGNAPLALGNSTNAGRQRIYIPRTGTVTRVDIVVTNNGTLGTTEQSTVSFRLNDTTDTALSTVVQFDAAVQAYAATPSIAVAAGDFFEIKLVAATFVTNPTTCILHGTVYVE